MTAFNWIWLRGSEVQAIIKGETWQHPGRHGKGRAESSVFIWRLLVENYKAARMGVLSPLSRPQWHTYSNKATPPNSATPWAKHIETISVFHLRNVFTAHFALPKHHSSVLSLKAKTQSQMSQFGSSSGEEHLCSRQEDLGSVLKK